MTIGIPDALTVDTSEKYNISIRLSPDGFSFSGNRPKKSDSFFHQVVSFDHSKPYLDSLKECIFEEECFSWLYKKVNILCVTPLYTFVPEILYNESKKKELLEYAFHRPPSVKVLENKLDGTGILLFGIEKKVYEFLFRTFVNATFIHHMTPSLTLWKTQYKSFFLDQMFVCLNQKIIDVACFKQGELLFLNPFEYHQIDDILYFLLSVWKQAGLNQTKDYLHVAGGNDCGELINKLRQYIRHSTAMNIPLKAHLWGKDIEHASYDLISLLACE